MKIDVLICGSPTVGFFSQVAYARLCLDALGGVYAKARMVLTLGEPDSPDAPAEIPAPWRPYLDRVEVIWANPDRAPNPRHSRQHNRRFREIRQGADVAILMDADICALAPFGRLLGQIRDEQLVAGVMAHYHFPLDGARGTDVTGDWDRVALAALGRRLPRTERYLFGLRPEDGPIEDPEARPAVPFYPNYGLLMGPPDHIRRIGAEEAALQEALTPITGDYWGPQIGLALAIAKLGLPYRALPPRYNMPNRKEARLLYPDEVARTVFCHYTEKRVGVDRWRFLAEEAMFQAFLEIRFKGADAMLQRHMRDLTGGVFPFPGVEAVSQGSAGA